MVIALGQLFRRRQSISLLDFEEVRRRLRLGTRIDEGLQSVAVERIIGSVARAREFDGAFRPRNRRLRRRIEEIRTDKPEAIDEPIELYRVDAAFFVVDGHKRLSLAIADGRLEIEARVGRYATPYELSPGANMDVIRLTAEEERFREHTGLAEANPTLRFPLTDPGGYLTLSESVKAHAYDLSRYQGRLLEPVEAARHWLETVYLPCLAVLAELRCTELMPSFTDADLFLISHDGNLHAFGPGWQSLPGGREHGIANVGRAAGKVVRRAGQRPMVLGRRERQQTTRPQEGA